MVRVENLSKNYFNSLKKHKKHIALDNVSFSIDQGETLGLVGESGCGKSTLARTMLGLIPPSSGKVFFNDREVLSDKGRMTKEMRGKMQIIFQHPESALNPRFKIIDSLAEPMVIQNKNRSKHQMRDEIYNLLEQVGLSEEHLYRYPNELSGGQIQRVMLARILSVKPEFIIADEPTSMLDASVQAQVMSILKNIQKNHGIGLLFISHDLDLVSCVSDRVAVMYKGKIIETAPSAEMKNNPLHPYSCLLTESFSSLNKPSSLKSGLMLNNNENKTDSGCSFAQHCPKMCDKCKQKPILSEKSKGHYAACWQV